jgi:hypothetical protein
VFFEEIGHAVARLEGVVQPFELSLDAADESDERWGTTICKSSKGAGT